MYANDWYRIAKNSKGSKPRDYSWISIELPSELSDKTIKFAQKIPERELYIEQDPEGETIHGKGWKYGVEDDPHITVLWGIHTKDVRKIQNILSEQRGGIVRLSKTGMFECDNYDVLKINIISPALHRLNSILRENVQHTTTHPDYKPHVTLAYLKCGNGYRYKDQKSFINLSFEFDKVIFEDYNDEKTTIELLKD